jgi:hypothetical protein
MPVVEQRRSQRFQLQLPLEIMRMGASAVSLTGTTRNISSGGVLFTSDTAIQIGGAIEYKVTLTDARGIRVNLRCIGKVLRQGKSSLNNESSLPYLVAATLDRYEFLRDEPAKN